MHWLKKGVPEVANNPNNSPVWQVKKADGKTWCLLVDCRKLDQATLAMAPVVANTVDTWPNQGLVQTDIQALISGCFFDLP